MAKKQTTQSKRTFPERTKDVPVTQSMLFGVRDQLMEQIHALSNNSDAKFHNVHSQLHSVKSELHRVALLIEEQNARNAIVLDGLTSLFTRQDRIETEFADLRKSVVK